MSDRIYYLQDHYQKPGFWHITWKTSFCYTAVSNRSWKIWCNHEENYMSHAAAVLSSPEEWHSPFVMRTTCRELTQWLYEEQKIASSNVLQVTFCLAHFSGRAFADAVIWVELQIKYGNGSVRCFWFGKGPCIIWNDSKSQITWMTGIWINYTQYFCVVTYYNWQ